MFCQLSSRASPAGADEVSASLQPWEVCCLISFVQAIDSNIHSSRQVVPSSSTQRSCKLITKLGGLEFLWAGWAVDSSGAGSAPRLTFQHNATTSTKNRAASDRVRRRSIMACLRRREFVLPVGGRPGLVQICPFLSSRSRSISSSRSRSRKQEQEAGAEHCPYSCSCSTDAECRVSIPHRP